MGSVIEHECCGGIGMHKMGCGGMTEQDSNDNYSVGVTGGVYRPDDRTEEEQLRARRRFKRTLVIARWKWRLRGLLPRGWGHNDCCECDR